MKKGKNLILPIWRVGKWKNFSRCHRFIPLGFLFLFACQIELGSAKLWSKTPRKEMIVALSWGSTSRKSFSVSQGYSVAVKNQRDANFFPTQKSPESLFPPFVCRWQTPHVHYCRGPLASACIFTRVVAIDRSSLSIEGWDERKTKD